MIQNLYKYLFQDKKFYENLYKIALPIIIQNFIASSLNMVDTMMIGRVGEIQIAAVGIANQYFFLFNLLLIGICSGCGIFISQFWGKRDTINIKKVLGIGMIAGAALSTIFTVIASCMPNQIIHIFNTDPQVILEGAKYLKIVCISYIFTAITFNFGFASRCIENTILPMVVSSFALLFNTFFNYVFIFGNFGSKAMGVEGAALATLLARIIEAGLLVGYIYFTKGVLAAKAREMFSLTKDFIKKVFDTVIPVVLNEGCWALGFVIYSVAYGRIGMQAMASVQICNTIINIFMVFIFGMSNGSVVMIGNQIGAGHEEQAKIYAKRFSLLACLAGIGLASILAISAPFILSFFKISYEVYHSALMILYINSGVLIIRVFNCILIVGILRAGGDAKTALLIEGFSMWCIGVPLAFLGAFYFKLPVHYVAALVTVEEIVKFSLGLPRLLSNKWIRNVTENM
ncbi:MATE family efflux transporter [Inediibacterium massiliense]|uniref:MATE family efflux transporter n=1 Tax=Inediibacterium massiliense TaxID=1658111 RepID=UPI0006B450A3|nr:MATE family efflux transporter [Inediibacterium massiliense]